MEKNFSFLINSEEANEILKKMKIFIGEFNENRIKYTLKEKSELIQNFISELIEIYIEKFKIDLDKENAYKEICDGIESLITKNLYSEIFCTTKEEITNDFNLSEKIHNLNFIKPENLEINPKLINEIYIEAAINSKKKILIFS
jgi:isoleucyl-tRNA synthetase